MTSPISTGFSIVVCTHNGERRLAATLEHLAALQIPDSHGAELIVVNNASTDNTTAFVNDTWKRLGKPFALKVLEERRAGKGYATETGYDAAQHSYIVTVDDDNWLHETYLIHAAALFQMDAAIGILQGHSTGAFEAPPPEWVESLKRFFIIGGPLEQTGYFPENDFYVWGAGMVIRTGDWRHIRSLGFSALTSKLPGKAAGEDNELAIALLLLGRRIYYSGQLQYRHFMPQGRVTWQKLKQNFETFGYVNHYFFLYTLIVDAYKEGYTITAATIRSKFAWFAYKLLRSNTWRQHIAYWIAPKHDYYQLRLHLYYAQYKWFFRLRKRALQDIQFIQSWMMPLLEGKPKDLEWPYKIK